MWDYNGTVGYGPVVLTIEWLAASQKVGVNHNKPKAIGETLAYTHAIWGKDTTFGIGHSNSVQLRDVPTSLEGQDAIPQVASGLKQSWTLGVWRPDFTKNFTLGFNATKNITYDKKQTFTYTLDFMAYL